MNRYIKIHSSKLNVKKMVIAHSQNYDIRYKATSGGIISSIIKHLFFEKEIDGTVSYEFDQKEFFVPKLINSWAAYSNPGSIYHEVNLIKFFKKNIHFIPKRFLIVCLPCQVKPIKRMLEKYKIIPIIISLTCSNQLTINATIDFLKYKSIRHGDIEFLKYRGGGWPSGISVNLKNGNRCFFHNNTSEWKLFFHSTIYSLRRCFVCPDLYGDAADFIMADPWLQRYMTTDTIGNTVVGICSEFANNTLNNMIRKKSIVIQEQINSDEFIFSQLSTIQKKEAFLKYPILRKIVLRYRNPIYKWIFSKYPHIHLKLHYKILNYYIRKLVEDERDSSN